MATVPRAALQERYLMLATKQVFLLFWSNQSSWPYPTFHTNESRLVYDIDANQDYEQLTREVCFISVITRHLLVTIEKRSHSTMRI